MDRVRASPFGPEPVGGSIIQRRHKGAKICIGGQLVVRERIYENYSGESRFLGRRRLFESEVFA